MIIPTGEFRALLNCRFNLCVCSFMRSDKPNGDDMGWIFFLPLILLFFLVSLIAVNSFISFEPRRRRRRGPPW